MNFVSFEQAAAWMRGKTVAVIGSAPTCLENEPGFVDAHEVVVRVNNYKTGSRQGWRCDVHYAFYGTSVKKSAEDLKRDGVTLCMCKLPNSKPLVSEWHEAHDRPHGVDYRYIYRNRKDWWFCPVFVPDDARFLAKFELLGKHQPTTGFCAILDVLDCKPASVYLTGFDWFASGVHNVDEPWRPGDPRDPIGHRPDLEAAWLVENVERYPITLDPKLTSLVSYMAPA